MSTRTHDDLQPCPLEDAIGTRREGQRRRVITMSTGQWDTALSTAYDLGWILLELDNDERPVRAYRKQEQTPRL